MFNERGKKMSDNNVEVKAKPVKKSSDKLKPMLFSNLKQYSLKQFGRDFVSGIIVAIIALPLSIALALA